MYCSRRLYKGNSYEICLPLTDSGVTLARFYTAGDVIIEKEPEITGDSMCFSFTVDEIASLPDGVLRYELVTEYETIDTNSPYVVVTPGDYSGSTLDDLLEDAYDSGYTSGYTDGAESCSGGSNEDLIANLENRYFVIPEGTTKLRPGAFSYGRYTMFLKSELSAMTIPSSVTEIGISAFEGNTSISSITIPDSVRSIGQSAFMDMHVLREVNIPSGVTEIPTECFYGAFTEGGNYTSHQSLPMMQFTIPSQITGIGVSAFATSNKLSDVTFEGSGVTSIPVACFRGCSSLTAITIPDSVTVIDRQAFSGCAFSAFTIPSGVTTIRQYAFAACSALTGISIPSMISQIEDYTFANCYSLSSLEWQSGITSIGARAFLNCYSLTDIEIPESVTNIAGYAFDGCSGITSMTFSSLVPPTINTTTSLGSSAYTFPIIVPCEAYEAYRTAFGTRYRSRIVGDAIAATGITLNVDSAITDSGQATVTIVPEGAEPNITYTSSDESIATIDSAGTITVISEGSVSICGKYSNICGGGNGTTCKTVRTYLSNPQPEPSGYTTKYFTLEVISGNSGNNLTIPSNVSSYRKNSGEWITNGVQATVDASTGDIFEMKGTGDTCANMYDLSMHSGYYTPSRFKVYGNIMSLFYGDDFSGKTELPSSASTGFMRMFADNTHLTDAENLIIPVSNYGSSGSCRSMFWGCSLLQTAPALPATGLTEGCYQHMFKGCASLLAAPSILPATILTTYCYGDMFSGCTSLTSAPELPATTLAQSCYEQMFAYCTSLTSAPELPATTLAQGCYAQMFEYCNHITDAPELLAAVIPILGYFRMFLGCTNLNYIKCLATDISAARSTEGFTTNISSTGLFTKHPNMSSWTSGGSGIPTGWTVQDAQI